MQSVPDTVSITTTNITPVANAGPDQAGIIVVSTVTLDGSASSDADGQPLTYQWSLIGKPAASLATLANATGVGPTFVPDVPGDYVAQLIVDDGFTSSGPDTVVVSVIAVGSNHKPIAEAGESQSADAPGTTVQLDGRGSSDPDGDPLTYRWRLCHSLSEVRRRSPIPPQRSRLSLSICPDSTYWS